MKQQKVPTLFDFDTTVKKTASSSKKKTVTITERGYTDINDIGLNAAYRRNGCVLPEERNNHI